MTALIQISVSIKMNDWFLSSTPKVPKNRGVYKYFPRLPPFVCSIYIKSRSWIFSRFANDSDTPNESSYLG